MAFYICIIFRTLLCKKKKKRKGPNVSLIYNMLCFDVSRAPVVYLRMCSRWPTSRNPELYFVFTFRFALLEHGSVMVVPLLYTLVVTILMAKKDASAIMYFMFKLPFPYITHCIIHFLGPKHLSRHGVIKLEVPKSKIL